MSQAELQETTEGGPAAAPKPPPKVPPRRSSRAAKRPPRKSSTDGEEEFDAMAAAVREADAAKAAAESKRAEREAKRAEEASARASPVLSPVDGDVDFLQKKTFKIHDEAVESVLSQVRVNFFTLYCSSIASLKHPMACTFRSNNWVLLERLPRFKPNPSTKRCSRRCPQQASCPQTPCTKFHQNGLTLRASRYSAPVIDCAMRTSPRSFHRCASYRCSDQTSEYERGVGKNRHPLQASWTSILLYSKSVRKSACGSWISPRVGHQ